MVIFLQIARRSVALVGGFQHKGPMIIFALHFILSLSHAQETGCWQEERNPYTKAIYTEAQWYEHIDAWNALQPPEPSLWSLFWAHQTYKQELDTANTLKNDKKKHCYIGCRIAQTTSLEVSTYVGWLKESEDITDCDRKTFFEMLDYQSTVDGALQGATDNDAQMCYDFCEAYKAPKNRIEL